ncbi:unnamed protein product [Lactuca saligna]|uniref:Uncharacterized protein n=1 Tax=Lactuca saligna TaxID=75948 RepID=A0AA35Z4I5_LACSI|nr:unnamed protein product [Lactuca saligna]
MKSLTFQSIFIVLIVLWRGVTLISAAKIDVEEEVEVEVEAAEIDVSGVTLISAAKIDVEEEVEVEVEAAEIDVSDHIDLYYQVTVDRPDVAGRVRILQVHSRGKSLAKDVDFDKVARRTPGPPPPPPPPPRSNHSDEIEKVEVEPPVARVEEDDIFVGEGIDYSVPSKDISQSPLSEDMEESPKRKERPSNFNEPAYGPVPPSDPSQDWQQTEYQYVEPMGYPEQYVHQDGQMYNMQGGLTIEGDPHLMTQEEKDRGLGSVFKRDDTRLQHLSDDEADLSKKWIWCREKGWLHRWDFETEEEWATLGSHAKSCVSV